MGVGSQTPERMGTRSGWSSQHGTLLPEDQRSHRGTGHREKQWVRVSSYRRSTKTPSSCRIGRHTGLGRGELPGAALPRVLPATPPGEVERLPSPALSPAESDENREPTPRQILSPLNHIHALNSLGRIGKTAPGGVSVFYLVLPYQPAAMFHRSPGRRGSRLPENIARTKATTTAENVRWETM